MSRRRLVTVADVLVTVNGITVIAAVATRRGSWRGVAAPPANRSGKPWAPRAPAGRRICRRGGPQAPRGSMVLVGPDLASPRPTVAIARRHDGGVTGGQRGGAERLSCNCSCDMRDTRQMTLTGRAAPGSSEPPARVTPSGAVGRTGAHGPSRRSRREAPRSGCQDAFLATAAA